MSNEKNGSRRLMSATVIIIALATTGSGWWLWLNATPQVKIPTRVASYPNGYDYSVQAYQLMVNREKLGWAIDETPLELRDKHPFTSDDHPFSLAEKDALLKANKNALVMLRQASAYQFDGPPMRTILDLYDGHEKQSQIRDVASLFQLGAQSKAGHGDWNGGINSCIDEICLGSNLPRGGDIMAFLVGRVIQARGRKDAWKMIDHLTSNKAKASAHRMEGVMDNSLPLSDLLTEEKWSTAAIMEEAFQSNNVFKSGLSLGAQPDNVPIDIKLILLKCSKRQVMARYLRFMDEFIAYAGKPYDVKAAQPEVPADPINVRVCENNPIILKTIDRNTRAENALLTTMLALHAFKMDHGHYPNSLSELAPAYLQYVPTDPYAINAPLRYKKTKNKYLIYSIGPDGKDDGGKWATDFPLSRHVPKPGTAEFGATYGMVTARSKGDVVPEISECMVNH